MSYTTPSTQQCVVNVADKHYTTSYYHCSCFTACSQSVFSHRFCAALKDDLCIDFKFSNLLFIFLATSFSTS